MTPITIDPMTALFILVCAVLAGFFSGLAVSAQLAERKRHRARKSLRYARAELFLKERRAMELN